MSAGIEKIVKKYHISKDGMARKCQAKTVESCRAMRPGFDEHYDSREEAQAAYEKSMNKKSGQTSVLSKKKALRKDKLSDSSVNSYSNDELLKPITIENDVDLDEFYNQLSEMQKFDTGGLKMYHIEPQEEEFIKAFANGEIPDEVPISLETNMVASMVHGLAQDSGYYAKITKMFAKSLKEKMIQDLGDKEPVVLDPLAGKGYFVKAMREQGVKTIGSDDKSWSKVQTDDFIEDLDAVDSLYKHGNKITHLLISWAPMSTNNSEDGVDKKLYDLVQKNFLISLS